MKKQPTDIGFNRTGVATSSLYAAKQVEASRESEPTEGDERALHEVRQDYQLDADPVGTMPPPLTLRGLAKSALKMLKGERPTVLLDKLGERCAYERTGTRLYQILVSRFEMFGEKDVGPTLVELRRFLGEEARHFELLVNALQSLGADPTVMTPCADTSAVMANGVIAVLTDPRTSAEQCLQAALVAELVDRDGWELLIDLARGTGLEDLAVEFEHALAEEENHLLHVRRWLAELTMAEARVRPPLELGSEPMQLLRQQRRRIDELVARIAEVDGQEETVVELASALQDEAEQLEAVGQELIARQTSSPN
jgi:ferritin-like protein